MSKKQPKKIKTSRYWTRKCDNCGFEYPNWFVQCPKCKKTWDISKEISNRELESINEISNLDSRNINEENLKTVRIIAQLTEEEVRIKSLTMYFTGDNGNSWYQITMVKENDYYVAEILNVPLDSIIIYYLKGIDENGDEFIEDNDGKFYYYNVRENLYLVAPNETNSKKIEKENIIEQDQLQLINLKEIEISDEISNESNIQISDTNEIVKIKPPSSSDEGFTSKVQFYSPNTTDVIFTPLDQIKKDKNLKTCPNCQGKIKKDWSVCPICGFKF